MLSQKQKKKVLRESLRYVKGTTALALSQSKKAKSVKESPCNIYRSITELPFDRYLAVLYADNAEYCRINDIADKYGCTGIAILSKDKNYNWLELLKAWEDIQIQFADAFSYGNSKHTVELLADIARLESRIVTIENICDSLLISRNEQLIKQLAKYGIIRPFTEESYLDDVAFARSFLGNYTIQLSQKRKEYEAMTAGSTETPRPEVFDQILAEIDPKLKPEDISTMRFCTLYNKLKRKAELKDKYGTGENK